jgi:hypothetical protein
MIPSAYTRTSSLNPDPKTKIQSSMYHTLKGAAMTVQKAAGAEGEAVVGMVEEVVEKAVVADEAIVDEVVRNANTKVVGVMFKTGTTPRKSTLS